MGRSTCGRIEGKKYPDAFDDLGTINSKYTKYAKMAKLLSR